MAANYKNNHRPLFNKSLVAMALMGVCATASAQQNATEQANSNSSEAPEVIEIKGQRGNIARAQDLKREASTFLDALSAADITALPDRSVTEAIQRLPGVTIERFAGANDPDHFGTEGSGVVIRGLTQTRSEFNGRSSFSANSGRGLSFQDVSPELIGSVKLYKNHTADLVEGGISGTVNLITKKPFDSVGENIAFTADLTRGTEREESSPTFSFLYSNRYETDAGEFGFLVNVARSELEGQSEGIQNGIRFDSRSGVGSVGETIDGIIPRGFGVRQKKDDRERVGGALAVQWRSPDKNTEITAEYIRSDASLEWTERAVKNDDNQGGVLLPVAGTQSTFDEDGVLTDGLLTHFIDFRGQAHGDADIGLNRLPNRTDWSEPSNALIGNALPYGALITQESRFRDDDSLVEDFSVNVKHVIDGRWFLEFDAQYVDSNVQVLDHTVFLASNAVQSYRANGNDAPTIGFHDPYFDGSDDFTGQLNQSNPSSTFWRSAQPHTQDNEGSETAFRFDAKYLFDDGIFESIKVGIRYSKRDQTTRESAFHWRGLKPEWSEPADGADGPGWIDASFPESSGPTQELIDSTSNLSQFTELVDFKDVYDGQLVGNTQFWFPSFDLARGYGQPEFANPLLNHARFGAPDNFYQLLNQRTSSNGESTVDGSNYLPEEINSIVEENTAVYVQGNFTYDFDDITIDGNVGVRYVQLDSETEGFGIFPDFTEARAIRESGADFDPRTIGFLFLPESDRQFGTGEISALTSTDDYNKLLPSFNIKVGLSEELIARFAVSKAIALPDLGLKRAFLRIQEESIEEVRGPLDSDGDGMPDLDENGEQILGVISASIPVYEATSGNPGLKPMESINYDASLEWYFSETNSLTVSLFYKDLKNFFITGQRRELITNPTTGQSQEVELGGATNGGEGTIKGYELAYTQYFGFLPSPFNNMGVQANYTRVLNDGVPNSGLKSDATTEDEINTAADIRSDLPLEGLSEDTANLALLYEDDTFNARLAYAWRSDYLLTSRDVITNLPVFNDEFGQLDASFFYKVNGNISVGIQGVNLTDAVTRTKILQDDVLYNRSFFKSERKYSLVVKGSF